jgi:hypothetical protein
VLRRLPGSSRSTRKRASSKQFAGLAESGIRARLRPVLWGFESLTPYQLGAPVKGTAYLLSLNLRVWEFKSPPEHHGRMSCGPLPYRMRDRSTEPSRQVQFLRGLPDWSSIKRAQTRLAVPTASARRRLTSVKSWPAPGSRLRRATEFGPVVQTYRTSVS